MKAKQNFERKIYIAYGSNMNIEQMANRCPTAMRVGTAELKNYMLTFRGGHDSAVATVEPKPGGSVPVVLWSITPADEAALDRYEGWPWLYRKERAAVTCNGKPLYGMIYIMNNGHPYGKPGPYYYSIILDGYIANGIPVDFLRDAVDAVHDAAPANKTARGYDWGCVDKARASAFDAARCARIIRMHEKESMSFRQIGDALGISRQRAHKIYHEGKARKESA